MSVETLCFAVVPDGQDQPAAVFSDLEDALNWALLRLGSDSFCVRRLHLVTVPIPPGGEHGRGCSS